MKKSKKTHIETPGVAEFANRINSIESSTNESWWAIGKILKEAADHYRSEATINEIASKTHISENKAIKLLQIARSKQLDDHLKEFHRIPSWTILYELTALTPDQFAGFLENHARDRRITVASVFEASGKKKGLNKSTREVLFHITWDKNAPKSLERSQAFECMHKAFIKAAQEIPDMKLENEQSLIAKRQKHEEFVQQANQVNKLQIEVQGPHYPQTANGEQQLAHPLAEPEATNPHETDDSETLAFFQQIIDEKYGGGASMVDHETAAPVLKEELETV